MNLKELGDHIGLDEDDYRELVELFIETGMVDFDQLKIALDEGDAAEVSRRAHTLSGASGNLGLMDFHEVAKRIELAAIDNQLDTVADDVITLKVLFDGIASAVRT